MTGLHFRIFSTEEEATAFCNYFNSYLKADPLVKYLVLYQHKRWPDGVDTYEVCYATKED